VSGTPWDNARLEQLDPRTLLLDNNSRTILDLEAEDPELVASVRKHGVKLPVLAARVDGDDVRVLDGHSRTIAATLAVAEHPTIPVLIIDVSADTDWELLRDQWIANEVRRGYSPADKARIMEKLTLFGLSAQDIADQLSTTPDLVEAGLAVRRSTKAAEITLAHPQLDVLQLAAVAEFEDDADATATLPDTLAEEPEQFDHAVARLRHHRAACAEREIRVAELRAAGVTVLDAVDSDTTLQLARLRTGKQNDTRLGDDPDRHASCPGHAAAVSVSYSEVQVKYFCHDWKAHGHVDAWSTSATTPRLPLTEAEKADRRRVRTNNEAWRAAQSVRRAWLRTTLFASKKPPKRAQQHLLMALAQGGPHLTHALGRGNRYACKLLGLREPKWGQPSPLCGRAKRATVDQALIMGIAVMVGAFEEALDSKAGVDTWRRPSPEDALYFSALKDWGYVLSTVERLVLDPKADVAALSSQ
jgi:ParB family chromosome partitioning protein